MTDTERLDEHLSEIARRILNLVSFTAPARDGRMERFGHDTSFDDANVIAAAVAILKSDGTVQS